MSRVRAGHYLVVRTREVLESKWIMAPTEHNALRIAADQPYEMDGMVPKPLDRGPGRGIVILGDKHEVVGVDSEESYGLPDDSAFDHFRPWMRERPVAAAPGAITCGRCQFAAKNIAVSDAGDKHFVLRCTLSDLIVSRTPHLMFGIEPPAWCERRGRKM